MTLDEVRRQFKTLEDWRAGTQPLAEQLPIRFANNAVLHDFAGLCTKCKKQQREEDVRGAAILNEFGTVLHIRAVGYCQPCNALNPIEYDVWDDLSMVGRDPDTDEIRRWQAWRGGREAVGGNRR